MAIGGRSDLCLQMNVKVAVLSDRANTKPLSPKARYKVTPGLGVVSVNSSGEVTARQSKANTNPDPCCRHSPASFSDRCLRSGGLCLKVDWEGTG
jgi:hypothetical protein